MTNQDIFASLCEILSIVKPKLDITSVTPESSLTTDLGIDSLSMMLLSLAVEEKYKFQFDNAATFKTVGDVCSYVERQVK